MMIIQNSDCDGDSCSYYNQYPEECGNHDHHCGDDEDQVYIICILTLRGNGMLSVGHLFVWRELHDQISHLLYEMLLLRKIHATARGTPLRGVVHASTTATMLVICWRASVSLTVHLSSIRCASRPAPRVDPFRCLLPILYATVEVTHSTRFAQAAARGKRVRSECKLRRGLIVRARIACTMLVSVFPHVSSTCVDVWRSFGT